MKQGEPKVILLFGKTCFTTILISGYFKTAAQLIKFTDFQVMIVKVPNC